MSDCFLYFRLWPGFTDPFPVDRFNSIANDQDLLQALDDYARGELARPEIRLQVKQVASRRRKNLLAGLKRQSARRSPAGFGNASVRKRLAKREWYWPRIRHADRRDPLVCRLGAYLGWWQKRWDESFPFGPRVWFYRVSSQELAEGFVTHLNGRTDLEYDGHEMEYYLRPRFGFVENSDTALQISAMRSVNAIRRGKRLDIRAGEAALAMGQKAIGIADEMLEALAPAEPSHPVPERTTLKQPSVSDPIEQAENVNQLAMRAVVDAGLAGVVHLATKAKAVDRYTEVMRKMLAADVTRYEWGLDDWVRELKASKPTIQQSDAWTEIMQWRESNRQQKFSKKP